MAVLKQYEWILALISIFFCVSSFGNGANDVANSYATSVAARTLTMPQVGILSAITEFIGAVAMGSRVTGTIKNGIIDISRFRRAPGTLMLVMTCAEVGSATWLIIGTKAGFPVSTTQTVVGAIIGAGLAAQAKVKWAWAKGSVSQIAASWAVSPLIAAGFAAIIFGTLKYGVLERKDPLKNAMRAIPFYFAFTAAVLALFIIDEAPNMDSFEEMGAGKVIGIILGVFFGMLLISYIFFIPYFHRRVVKNDARLKFYHIPLGPLLLRENPPLYFPGNAGGDAVKDYYQQSHRRHETNNNNDLKTSENSNDALARKLSEHGDIEASPAGSTKLNRYLEPEERFLAPTAHLPIYNPARLWSWVKYILLQGVTRDCVTHDDARILAAHALATKYDNRVEHLWTYAQVASALMMSIAHGSNDVANAVGPWVATYNTYQTGTVTSSADTPIWILVIAGLLLGAGFWFFGHHIIKALGNRITQLSPTRGFSMELGSAITVLLASRLGLPVSTTQCITGAVVGVALMNYSVGAVNWRQIAKIFLGWVLTLPIAGLIAGLLCLVALNTPHF